MQNWVAQIQQQLQESALVTLVTVIGTHGSVPRAPGARMMVTPDQQWGTIGGGNLEFNAVTEARDRQLANKRHPQRQKFALGPGLGQCCGGSVEVLYETITRETRLPEYSSGAVWCRRIDAKAEECDHQPIPESPLSLALNESCSLRVFDDGDQVWLAERIAVNTPTVVVFGAGHVGSALIKQLTLLQCTIIWIDERADQFPNNNILDQVSTIQTDWPEQEVPDLPDDAWVIVMTHSHSTDFNICLALLKKQQFAFLGLIGSNTKRNTFRKRLLQRGINEAVIDRLCCPIGLAEISSSRPESIALGVTAQLAQLWEAVYEK